MKSSELGLLPMYRLLKNSGAHRISEESAEELRRITEEVAFEVAKSAVDLCEHAGRRTVKAEDIKLASRNILKT